MNLSELVNSYSNQLIGAAVVAWGAFAGRVAVRFSKPHVGYHRFRVDERTTEFILRSYEPTAVPETLTVVVEPDDGDSIAEVRVFAGPWLRKHPQHTSSAQSVVVSLDGVPPEGIVGIRVMTTTPQSHVKLNVHPDSRVRPRDFGEIAPWKLTTRIARSFSRWLFGVSSAVAAYVLTLAIGRALSLDARFRPSWDIPLVAVMLALSVVGYALATPIRGRETVPGGLDWPDATTLWREGS
jgi:hypothetical protein